MCGVLFSAFFFPYRVPNTCTRAHTRKHACTHMCTHTHTHSLLTVHSFKDSTGPETGTRRGPAIAHSSTPRPPREGRQKRGLLLPICGHTMMAAPFFLLFHVLTLHLVEFYGVFSSFVALRSSLDEGGILVLCHCEGRDGWMDGGWVGSDAGMRRVFSFPFEEKTKQNHCEQLRREQKEITASCGIWLGHDGGWTRWCCCLVCCPSGLGV
ncbi:hypothetical protein VTG60DRAFT_2803 [Thermothelomyces hinnuleus]